MALTAKQERFVAEYLIDQNATQAAIRAGYSEKTAYSQGQRLLKNVEVAAAVASGQAERAERTGISMDYVIQRLAIEAEREGEGSSHSARVAALGHLRNHFTDQQGGGGDGVADALNKIADKLPG